MTLTELDKFLREHTWIEKRAYVRYIATVPTNDKKAEEEYIRLMDSARPDLKTPELYYDQWDEDVEPQLDYNEFQKKALTEKRLPSVHAAKSGMKNWLNIQKHSRYSSMYDHYHSFIEINYMYSGKCVNMVDGQEVNMEKGDFVIMKPGSVHRIVWTGENDILMNIILLPNAAGTILDKVLIGKNDLTAFFVEAIYSKTPAPNHLYLKTRNNEDIQNTLKRLMCEYFEPENVAADVLVGCYLQEVFALILRETEQNPGTATYAKKPSSLAAEIVSYISENCISCTRESVAEHFGYSGSRISNLLAEYIGKGFVQLRNEFRMYIAEKYLTTTNLPVTSIAEECGFTNMTQFYKIYRSCYGKLPRKQ